MLVARQQNCTSEWKPLSKGQTMQKTKNHSKLHFRCYLFLLFRKQFYFECDHFPHLTRKCSDCFRTNFPLFVQSFIFLPFFVNKYFLVGGVRVNKTYRTAISTLSTSISRRWFSLFFSSHFRIVMKWGVRLHANFSFYPFLQQNIFLFLRRAGNLMRFSTNATNISYLGKDKCMWKQNLVLPVAERSNSQAYSVSAHIHVFSLFVSSFFIWSYVNLNHIP